MAAVSRTRATLFPRPENGEAGARRVRRAPPASRIFVSFRHHFGDRCVRARVPSRAFRSTALRSGAFAPDGLYRCRFSSGGGLCAARPKQSIEAPARACEAKVSWKMR